MAQKDVTGRWGEQTAARFLAAAGLLVVERNWRCHEPGIVGEIDIVAREAGTVVFCEVKTRTGVGFGDPAEAVTWDKQRRLRRLAAQWLADHPESGAPDIRFDVVAVVRPRVGLPTVRHVRAAF